MIKKQAVILTTTSGIVNIFCAPFLCAKYIVSKQAIGIKIGDSTISACIDSIKSLSTVPTFAFNLQ